MGSLILGLIFAFGFIVGFFFMPLLGVLFAAVLAGMAARGPGKGLIAGAAGGAIVGTVIHYFMGAPYPQLMGLVNSGGYVLIYSGAPPEYCFSTMAYLGWVAPYFPIG